MVKEEKDENPCPAWSSGSPEHGAWVVTFKIMRSAIQNWRIVLIKSILDGFDQN